MPGNKQFGGCLPELVVLVTEDFQNKPGVQFGVIYSTSFELAVLIVFDEVVIGIAGKGERVKPQSIYRR